MKIKLHDNVLVIAGKDKGKTGKVIKTYKKRSKVVVEKVNVITKHIKKTPQRAGDRIKYEAPIDVSNVMILDPKENKPTRVGYKKLENGKKERVSKISGASLDQKSVSKKAKKVVKEESDEKESAKKATKSKPKKIKA
jgi:large subunit ribosomal protein L24